MATGPEFYEFLARGYAWGHADASNQGKVTGTNDGIEFGIAYRTHCETSRRVLRSVQDAYTQWKETGVIS